MPRKKEHDTQGKQVAAWQAEKTDRIAVNVRKDAPINKDVINRAAKASGAPTAAFIMQAVHKYILDTLGPEWLEENQNKGAGKNGD